MKTPNLEKLIERVERELYDFDTAMLVTKEAKAITQALRKATEALEFYEELAPLGARASQTLTEIESLATKELK